MKTYRVGVAALVHDHVWGELKRWQALGDKVEIVAAGDVNADLRDKIQRDYGVPKVYESWQAMLDAEGANLDIVQIAAENSVHADIVEACASRGLHMIVEKPMAATLAQAERMARAAEAAGVTLMVNWPTAWHAPWQEFERRILAGEIGDVRYYKYRSAHNGPREIGCDPHFVEWLYDAEKNGAGAYMDYICYGAAMCSRFLGLPSKVNGMRAVLAKDYPLPDDNAVVTLQYPHAFGVLEGSWTQPTGYITPNPIAYGSAGAIGIQNGEVILLRPGRNPAERIAPPEMAAPRRSGPEYLVRCIETGEKPEGICSVEISLKAQRILDAGLRAADTGETQTVVGG